MMKKGEIFKIAITIFGFMRVAVATCDDAETSFNDANEVDYKAAEASVLYYAANIADIATDEATLKDAQASVAHYTAIAYNRAISGAGKIAGVLAAQDFNANPYTSKAEVFEAAYATKADAFQVVYDFGEVFEAAIEVQKAIKAAKVNTYASLKAAEAQIASLKANIANATDEVLQQR